MEDIEFLSSLDPHALKIVFESETSKRQRLDDDVDIRKKVQMAMVNAEWIKMSEEEKKKREERERELGIIDADIERRKSL